MAGKKRALLTLLEDDKVLARSLAQELARSGLEVQIHVLGQDQWAWAGPARELPSFHVWVIAGKGLPPAARKGLSLTALSLQGRLPIILDLLDPEEKDAGPDSLPTPLRDAVRVGRGLAAKAAVLAATYRPITLPYRLLPIAMGQLGLWFELGPREGEWDGAFFAAGGAEPTAHGVGACGQIPEKSTLEYPVRGVSLDIHGVSACGYGVKNRLTHGMSYFVKVSACPDILCFGPFPETDTPELHTLTLV